MTSSLKKGVSLEVTQLTKQDLREFLEELDPLPENARISFMYYAGDQREPAVLTLSASLPDARSGIPTADG